MEKSSRGFINKVGNIIKFKLFKQDILDFEHNHTVSDITDFDSHIPQIDTNVIAKWGGNTLVSDDSLNISAVESIENQLVGPSIYTLNDLLPAKSVTSIEGVNDDLQELSGTYESPKLYRIVYKHGTKADQFLLYCDGLSSGVLRQTLIRPDGFWTRTNSNEWTSWEKIYYALQNDINDVYSRIMTVIQQEVSNLNVSLAGKSNVGHTHPIEEFPSVISWVNEQLDASSKSTLEYVDSVEEKLLKEIDKTVDSYFAKGVPTLDNYPAVDWKVIDPETHEEDEEATYIEYAKHEGDTYTNIQNFKELDISNWEQGGVKSGIVDVESFDNCKYTSDSAIRYKELIDYEAGDTLQVLSKSSDYLIRITYYDTYEILKEVEEYDNDENQVISLSDSYSKFNISIISKTDQSVSVDVVEDLLPYINSTADHSWRFCRELDDHDEIIGWYWNPISNSDAMKALLMALKAQDAADKALDDATSAGTAADNALNTAEGALGTADTALQKGNSALGLLSNMASFDVITSLEKLQIVKEWQLVRSRRTYINTKAAKYEDDPNVVIFINLFNNSFNLLKDYLLGIPDSSGIIGRNGQIDESIIAVNTEEESVIETVITLFEEYYISEVALLNSILEHIKIGSIRIVDDNSVSVVTDTNTTWITNNTLNSVADLQDTYSGSISVGIGLQYDSDPNEYSANDVVIGEKSFTVTKGGVYSILISNVTITPEVKTQSNSLSGDQTDFGHAYANASGKFCIRIKNNDRLVYVTNYSNEFEIESDNTTGSGSVVTESDTKTISGINSTFALSPGTVTVQIFGSYGVKAVADAVSLTCSGGISQSAINFSTVTISMTGTEKYCIIAKDGIGVINTTSKFFIKNNNSELQIIASGLPTSTTGLSEGQLYEDSGILKVYHSQV